MKWRCLTRAGLTRTSRPWSGMLTEMFQSSPNEHTTTPATATRHSQNEPRTPMPIGT